MKLRSVSASIFVLFVLAFASMVSIPPVNAVIQNGPRMSNLYFMEYLSSATEWADLQLGNIDIMDCALTTTQYQQWLSSPALQAIIYVEVTGPPTGPIYTAYRNVWRGIVNEDGIGVRSWWSTFLSYNVNPSVNVVKMGLSSGTVSLNPITSTALSDHIVMERVFDTLVGHDAFTPTTLLPNRLALSWEVGTWIDAGVTKTTVKFKLRPGLVWHPSPSIYFDPIAGGDGATILPSPGAPLSVDDAAFSLLYHQAQNGYFSSAVSQIKEVQTKYGQTVSPIPGSYLTATWTAESSLDVDEVLVRMNVLSGTALSYVGGVYIIPAFIWKHVLDAFLFNTINAGGIGTGGGLVGSGPWKYNSIGLGVYVLLAANLSYYLSTGTLLEGTGNYHAKEMFHRKGDAGRVAGSGPDYYDGKVNGVDLAYFSAVYSTNPYTNYPMPNYWRDDLYTSITYDGVTGGSSVQTGIAPPFDGTGQESTNNANWGSVTPYPWRVQNPGAGPPWFYADFNYDHKVDAFDFAILGTYWGTDAGSGW